LQRRLLSADHQCMAGIVAALKANDALCMIGQPINNLALTFVAPLGTDDDDILCITFL